MLGKYVRVKVTQPINSYNKQFGYKYQLNYGIMHYTSKPGASAQWAYIMGINHSVRNFDGRVIARIRRATGSVVYVVAPKRMRFIQAQIEDAIKHAEGRGKYHLDCLYEYSCGAVVYRIINGMRRYLLIKNRRSAHWGFPKGHIERGETDEDTARREVLEETGIHIQILPQFASKSEYTIQGRVEKSVTIFLAKTQDTQTTIQREEIEDYIWLNFDKAMDTLRFINDRNILQSAHDFLAEQNII